MSRAFIILASLFCANVFAESVLMLKDKSQQNLPPLFSFQGNDYSYIDNLSAETPLTRSTENIRKNSSDCLNGKPIVGGPTFMNNLSALQAPLSSYACAEADRVMQTKKLDPQICEQVANCYNSRSRSKDGSTIGIKSKSLEKVASEAISLISQIAISEMMDFEELKRYSLEKYGKDFIPNECSEDSLAIPPKVDTLKGGCMTNVIDKGYEIAQLYCKVPERGCKPKYLEFIKDKNTENTKTSLLADFIKQNSIDQVKIYSGSDSKIANDIAKIVIEKNITPEERAEKVLFYMHANYNKLDPVFKSYCDNARPGENQAKSDVVRNGIVKLILQNQEHSAEDVYKNLENLRMSQAKLSLKKKCSSSLKMEKLCKIASDVLNGGNVTVPEASFNKMLSHNNTVLAMKPGMSIIEMGEYVARCNTYILTPENLNGFAGNAKIKLSKGNNLFSNTPNGIFTIEGFTGNTYLSADSYGHFEEDHAQLIFDPDGSIRRKDSETSVLAESLSISKTSVLSQDKISDSVLIDTYVNNHEMSETYNRAAIEYSKSCLRTSEKMPESSEGLVQKKEENALKTSGTVENLSPTQNQPNALIKPTVSSVIHPIENSNENSMNLSPKSENNLKANNSGNVDYNQLLSKIAGLEDKLAQAQKKSPTSVVDKISDVKIDSKPQEESELVKELRSAKSALSDMNKNYAEKEKIKTTVEAVNTTSAKMKTIARENNSDIADSISVASTAPVSQAASRIVALPAPTTALAPRNLSETSERAGSNAEEAKTSSGRLNTSENATYTIGEGVVLTRLDGVAKSKVSDTINKMIVTELGKPFYIEEGGIIKQIIPEIVNGKIIFNENGTPIYKTIVKGKVGEFKVDTKDKSKAKRETAAIASPADLKMQEEKVVAPAIRYRDLQDILKLKK